MKPKNDVHRFGRYEVIIIAIIIKNSKTEYSNKFLTFFNSFMKMLIQRCVEKEVFVV